MQYCVSTTSFFFSHSRFWRWGSLSFLWILALPLLVLLLLVGLGLIIHVLANEGRGRSSRASRVVGVLNLATLLPLALLAVTAAAPEQRNMFMFVAVAFALVGLLGLRIPLRFRDP